MDSNHNRNDPTKRRPAALARRTLLGWGAASLGAAALGAACKATPEKEENKAPAITGVAGKPETPGLRFGMIALTDCSPIVIAHEKGFFKKYGIDATIVKGAS